MKSYTRTKEDKEKISARVKERIRNRREYEAIHGRECTKCKQIKPIDVFAKRKNGTIIGLCPECKSELFKKWYYTERGQESTRRRARKYYHTDKRRITARIYTNKHRVEWYKLLIEMDLNKCCKCGYDKNVAALDFHHINGQEDKTMKLNGFTSRGISEPIIDELKKCICLCSNCHREEHHNKKNYTMKEYIEMQDVILKELNNESNRIMNEKYIKKK